MPGILAFSKSSIPRFFGKETIVFTELFVLKVSALPWLSGPTFGYWEHVQDILIDRELFAVSLGGGKLI